jgi:hypothetical protein
MWTGLMLDAFLREEIEEKGHCAGKAGISFGTFPAFFISSTTRWKKTGLFLLKFLALVLLTLRKAATDMRETNFLFPLSSNR